MWSPYVRGERTPLHDPDRRSGLDGLDLTQGPAALRRAAFEAAGFVVRHHLDLASVPVRRLVLTGGGVRVAEWVQALADCTGLPVDVVAVPEGGALGSAFFARLAAGLETDATAAGVGPASTAGSNPTPPGSSPAPAATDASASWPMAQPATDPFWRLVRSP